jgi:3-oxoacyl-[acyl-carrier protein] reductase
VDIAGKNIVITGGARGLGRQYAMDMKHLGAKPYAVDVSQENLDALREKYGIPGKVVDVSREQAVEDFFESYTAEYGAPQVLINNAGITADALLIKSKDGKIKKFGFSYWEKVLKVNLTGVFLCAREATYQMVKHEVKGVIINISSISRAGNRGQTNYSATKSAVDAMTVTWSKELSRYGIRVAAIAPGFISTEMVEKIRPDVLEKIVGKIPAGRLGWMEEISQAAQFIITNDFFSGRVLEVDGGMRI